MHILIILTSHDRLGATGRKTGFWLEEFATPYYAFLDAGAEVTLASPRGGLPPIDPVSETEATASDATRRLDADASSAIALANTLPLATLRAEDFDALFIPGGHGPMWDLVEDAASIRLIEALAAAGKPIGAVCHGPAALLRAREGEASLLRGKRVTGFSNSEEQGVGLAGIVPFLLEDALRDVGGDYSKGADGESFVVSDGAWLTGQNPASSAAVAAALVRQLAPAA